MVPDRAPEQQRQLLIRAARATGPAPAARLPGPHDPQRSAEAAILLPMAQAAAAAAGVTRLADVTRLDRIGMPVWQAVRPSSRSLSVHQGKGASDAEAQLGALLEATESHWAEQFDAPGPVCRFEALPLAERPASLHDFAAHRHDPPDPAAEHRWVEASDLLTGARLHLPFELVSLDFTRHVPSRFDRASNGVATGANPEEALAAALHELIERDGVVEWRARGLVERTASQVPPETIPFDWFHFWRDRLRAAAITLRCYAIPSLTGSPLQLCELRDDGKDAAPYRTLSGRGCHPDPEVALFKALAEAIQGRATYIAGAREDIMPFYGARPDGAPVPFGLPLPAGMTGVPFADIPPGPRTAAELAEALARAGFPQIAAIPLADPEGFSIVRAFVYGLGSMTRRRRPA